MLVSRSINDLNIFKIHVVLALMFVLRDLRINMKSTNCSSVFRNSSINSSSDLPIRHEIAV